MVSRLCSVFQISSGQVIKSELWLTCNWFYTVMHGTQNLLTRDSYIINGRIFPLLKIRDNLWFVNINTKDRTTIIINVNNRLYHFIYRWLQNHSFSFVYKGYDSFEILLHNYSFDSSITVLLPFMAVDWFLTSKIMLKYDRTISGAWIHNYLLCEATGKPTTHLATRDVLYLDTGKPEAKIYSWSHTGENKWINPVTNVPGSF